MVLVGQVLYEIGFVFGTYQAFVDTNFLMRGVMMPEYPVCMVHKGFVPCAGIIVWFSGAWQSFVVDEVEESQQVGKAMLGKHFPKPWVGLGIENGLLGCYDWPFYDAHIYNTCQESFHLVHGNSGPVL
jgi:hypothetical protein